MARNTNGDPRWFPGRSTRLPTIRPEIRCDLPRIRDVRAAAFGNDAVPDLADALRAAEAGLKPVSLVAARAGEPVGHVMLSASRLDAPLRLVDVYVLSPRGVRRRFQRSGIGTALVENALAAADRMDMPLVFLEGGPDFCRRRGFQRASMLGLRSPLLRIPDPAFQVALLQSYQPWMMGTLVHSETFWALDCVGLR